MTWNLIPIPAPEELAYGYTPALSFEEDEGTAHAPSEGEEMRRYLVTIFVIFGLLAGLNGLFSDETEQGQRRLAEINLSDRKVACQACEPILELHS